MNTATQPRVKIFDVVHSPSGYEGLVFLTNKELYETEAQDTVCVYLDVNGETIPKDVSFQELQIKSQVR